MTAGKSLADAEARSRIETDLDRTFLVEAAAGTGKTTSLVSRMVALIRTNRCRVDQIAAITFTVKAAAELRERFQEALEHAARTSDDTVERELLQNALRDFATCFAGTIHAFCARLLRERPVEAGLDPAFAEVTEEEAAKLPLDFWNRYVQGLFAAGDSTLVELRETGARPNELHAFFGRLCEYPDVEPVSADFTSTPDLSNALAETLAFLEFAENELLADSCPDEDKLKKTIGQMSRRRRFVRPGAPGSIIPFLEIFDSTSARKPTYKNWSLEKRRVVALHDAFDALFLNTVGPALRRWREYVHALIVRIMKPAVEEFAEERRAAGKLTYQDLLLNAQRLLREHANVRSYYQRRFPYLLVDEFQDTDPIQAEIVFYLTGTDVAERDWRKLAPRPGSLFIVGDPKQSIYRFRRADIVTYLQVQEQIERSGGEVLSLTTNFRSLPEICKHVNDFFEHVFAGSSGDTKRQARHAAANAHRATTTTTSGVYLLETPSSADVQGGEAQCIAAWIRDAVALRMQVADDEGEREATWSDFMLLSRTTPHRSRRAFRGHRGARVRGLGGACARPPVSSRLDGW